MTATSIQCPLNSAAERYENLPALIAGDRVISYGEYERVVGSTAVRLKRMRVAKGSRVAIISNNRWEYPVLLFALLRLGAVACPANPRFPEESILTLLRKIDCITVMDPLNKLTNVTSDGLRGIGLDVIVTPTPVSSTGQALPSPVKPALARHDRETLSRSLTRSGPGGEDLEGGVLTDLNHDATIIFTSGTSARPKAVVHSLGNHHYSALGSNRNIPVQPGDRWLLSLPLYHVGGLGILFRTLLGGGAVVIPGEKESIAESIEKHDVTHLSLVSTQLYRLLNDGLTLQRIKRLKAVLVGGSAVPTSLIARAHEAGLPLYTTYGLTEMASQVTTTAPQEPSDRLLTSGKVLDYRSLNVSDGEILVKGETLFKGYVQGRTTTLPVDDEGWFRTGDLGRLDSDGYLKFLGRKDNMFVSGGENIHPEEIEGVLSLFDEISEAIVVPIEDKEFGFRPVAFIRTRNGTQIDERDVVSRLEHSVPRFKIPVSFYEWPDKAGESRLKPDRRYLAKLAQKLRKK